MIYTNALSMFILHHNQSGIFNKNIFTIQYIIRTREPTNEKFKCMYKDFPNIVILTKSDMPVEVQMTFTHAPLVTNPLGNLLLHFPWQYHSTHIHLFQLMPTLPSPIPEKISASQSLRYSSAPPPEILQGLRIIGTGQYSMTSLYHHSWQRRRFLTGRASLEDLLKIFARCITEREEEEEDDVENYNEDSEY